MEVFVFFFLKIQQEKFEDQRATRHNGGPHVSPDRKLKIELQELLSKPGVKLDPLIALIFFHHLKVVNVCNMQNKQEGIRLYACLLRCIEFL